MHPARILKAACAVADRMTAGERDRLEEFQVYSADDYAEPGYSTEKGFVITGNYNPTDFKNPGVFGRVCDALEKIAELEWPDEWATCCECGKLVRTSADCWMWTRFYHMFEDGDIVCGNCIDNEEYLDDIANNPRRAITLDVDPTEYGFEKYNGTFENGLHPGQSDNPQTIMEYLHKQGKETVVFKIDHVGQFDCHFEAYAK